MRLHDLIYLKQNNYLRPKEKNKLLLKIIKKRISNKKIKILDIGCATGELIFFLDNALRAETYGCDINKKLINKAKKNCKNSQFKLMDIGKNINFKEKFDIIICSGLIGNLENLNIFFKNLKKLSKKNTIYYLSGIINEFNYNVYIKYEDLNLKKRFKQSGWNSWSINYISKFLNKKKLKKYKLKISFDIKKDSSDLMKSWTVKINKERYLFNALNLARSMTWYEFR